VTLRTVPSSTSKLRKILVPPNEVGGSLHSIHPNFYAIRQWLHAHKDHGFGLHWETLQRAPEPMGSPDRCLLIGATTMAVALTAAHRPTGANAPKLLG